MKHLTSKPPAKPKKPGKSSTSDPPGNEASFDTWLKRGLHQLYDDVANEPVPEELLRLIEEDRTRGKP